MSKTVRRERTADHVAARTARITARLHAEARDYYRLVDAAAAAGVPVSLDDPAAPRTVAGLRQALAVAA